MLSIWPIRSPDCKTYPLKKDYKKGKQVKAKIFTLTWEERTEDANVMTGILSIFELPAYLLINSEFTRSFISIVFISRTEYEKSSSVLKVTIPPSRILNINQITSLVKLEMDGKETRKTLISYPKNGQVIFQMLGKEKL